MYIVVVFQTPILQPVTELTFLIGLYHQLHSALHKKLTEILQHVAAHTEVSQLP